MPPRVADRLSDRRGRGESEETLGRRIRYLRRSA